MEDITNSHAERKASKKLLEWKFLVSRNVNLNYVMLITTRRHLTSLRAFPRPFVTYNLVLATIEVTSISRLFTHRIPK